MSENQGLLGAVVSSGVTERRELWGDAPIAPPEQRYPQPTNPAEVTATPQPSKRVIEITPMDYGYAVRVGCQAFCIEDTSRLVRLLDWYLSDHESAEKQWMKNKKLPNV